MKLNNREGIKLIGLYANLTGEELKQEQQKLQAQHNIYKDDKRQVAINIITHELRARAIKGK